METDTSNVTPIRRERTLGELLHDLRTACDELDKLIHEPLPWPTRKLAPGTPDPRD